MHLTHRRIGLSLCMLALLAAMFGAYTITTRAQASTARFGPAPAVKAKLDQLTARLESCMRSHGATPHQVAEGTAWSDPDGAALAACKRSFQALQSFQGSAAWQAFLADDRARSHDPALQLPDQEAAALRTPR